MLATPHMEKLNIMSPWATRNTHGAHPTNADRPQDVHSLVRTGYRIQDEGGKPHHLPNFVAAHIVEGGRRNSQLWRKYLSYEQMDEKSHVNIMTDIPTRHRPLFDGLTTPEEKFQAAMDEYNELKGTDADGLDFSNKTAMWIAFERDIESQRKDALFKDILAKHFCEPYGQRLSDAMSFGLAFSVFDPPPDSNIGFGLEGHVMYTAARTKLINDQLEQWLEDMTTNKKCCCQVLNLGAGVDTRVYWMESLKKANGYWEVDTASVMNHKQKILDHLKETKELPDEKCQRKAITMDFSKESVSDLPASHGYDSTVPTCWILEGLIMYLKPNEQEQLLDNLSTLSVKDSFLVLNFSTNTPGGLSSDEIDERLGRQGWKKIETLMFGDKGFHFSRYPAGKPANKVLGFSMYRKA